MAAPTTDSFSATRGKSSAAAVWALRLAALWVLAGAAFKLWARNPNDLPPLIREMFRGHLGQFLAAAIGIELALALLAWIKPRWSWFWMAGMFLVFLGLLAEMASRGLKSCGCFGGSVTLSPQMMMGIDGACLLAILATRPWKTIRAGHGVPAAIAVLGAAVCLAIPWFIVRGEVQLPIPQVTTSAPTPANSTPAENVAATTAPPEAPDLGDFQELNYQDWIGKPAAATKLVHLVQPNLDALPPDGKWIFYRQTCDHCAAYLMSYTGADDFMPVALIEIGDDKPTEENKQVHVLPSGDHVTYATLVPGPAYIVTPPLVLEVVGGEIVSAVENAEWK